MTASMQNINLFTDRNNQFCGDITYTLTGPLNKWTTASCIETALSPVITDTEACLAITGVALTSSSTACEAVQKANGGGQACSYKPSQTAIKLVDVDNKPTADSSFTSLTLTGSQIIFKIEPTTLQTYTTITGAASPDEVYDHTLVGDHT